MNIGTNIYTLRKEKKITQSQLAEKLGVSIQSISKWENNLCAPDVSLFPIIADYFGVSIDRIFGYHINSYEKEVEAIIKAADYSMDTYKEIEIISNGLKKYPNSPDLKIYLAFSFSMVNRISTNRTERNEAVKKAIKLCNEVIETCKDVKQADKALNMLTRIYNETGNYGKAADAISKISADHYDWRLVETVIMLGLKKSYKEQLQFAEDSMWKLYWTMSRILSHVTNSLTENKEYEKAIAFFIANEKMLSIFDEGCPDFFSTYKMINCERKAKAYMKIGDKDNCLKALTDFIELSQKVKAGTQNEDFNIAVRNPTYFSDISEEIREEYLANIYSEETFNYYDEFLNDSSKYIELKKKYIEILHS